MTDRNYTCVASAVQSSKKKPSVNVGDIFINNQGCKAIVVEYENSSNILIEFTDKYKHRLTVTAQNLRKRQTKNPYYPIVCGVGFTGVGQYVTWINGRHTAEYQAWRDMIRRCYDENLSKNLPTYVDCTVCDEWHNFQNFAEWYTNQKYYGKGYHLDKDLLFDGNKIYSPENCVLAPQELNTLMGGWLVDKKTPTGVAFNKKTGKYVAYVTLNKKRKHLGYFSNMDEAREAYLAEKLKTIKTATLDWKSSIDEKLFTALMNKDF